MSIKRVKQRILQNGGPWWWRDALTPTDLPCVETRWVAGVRYTRAWAADGTYVDRVGAGKHVASASWRSAW